MTAIGIGVLAEDQTDCDALVILVRRIAKQAKVPTIRVPSYASRGCAKLRAKAESQMKLMLDDGCSAVVLVHDLDRNPNNQQLNDAGKLRRELEQLTDSIGSRRHICIPIEELEAWFWSDQATVSKATRGNDKAKAQPSPHLIVKPKEALARLSRGLKGKSRYDTKDNKDLAEILDLPLCESRCPSFRDLAHFIRTVIT